MRIDTGIRLALSVVVILELCGCAHNAQAPISQKSAARRDPVTIHRSDVEQLRQRGTVPTSYIVRRGDTLYSIAWKFGLDFRNVSKWNAVANPNLIYIGQKLNLAAPIKSPSPKQPKRKQLKRKQARAKPPVVKKTYPAVAKTVQPKAVAWSWPAAGKVQPASSALGTKGIEILGSAGQPVKAAGGGIVVYSGSGLRGYGQLIIVKHNEQFLSAYAHNARLVVSEGEAVKQGQKIAEMGNTDAKRVMLHFEIRRDGKAVEPLKFLPKR
jgi:lipoprotein NlpD